MAGALLAEREKPKGAREPRTNRGITRSDDATTSTLADLGVSKQQSSDWQLESSADACRQTA